ncbi:DUF6207 family protein [Streptomyces sp. NPDC002701]|uniref:DUF6207 family protein n=1 Tax=Streptomyces sp. NPDC002701 TaxID=3364661 RepID=UPI003697128E
MRPIHDTHVALPGLAVVDVAAADDATASAVQNLLATHHAIAPADRTTRKPGEPGCAASSTCATPSSPASTDSRASAVSPPDTTRPPPPTRQRSVLRHSCSG